MACRSHLACRTGRTNVSVGGHEAYQLCPLGEVQTPKSCTECMDSDECHRRVSESTSCPCCCADLASLGERLLEAWSEDRDRVGALSFPCWEGLELFSPGSSPGLLSGQEGPHSGVLAVVGCLLGLSNGNFFAGWCCFTTSFLCVSTPGETLLPSGNDCEGAISWENS